MKAIEKIRMMRELNHWTQEQMADKLHMSVTSYAKLERGERKISLEELERIAVVFSLDIIDLLSVDKQNVFCFINSDSHMQNVNYYGNQNLGSEIEKLKLIVQHQQNLLNEKDEMISQQKDHIKTLNHLLQTFNTTT